jgi:putative transposase
MPRPGKQAEKQKRTFQLWCKERHFEAAADCLDYDWERMVGFYHYPKEHWIHLRTTNPIESPFAAVRLRTDAGKRFKRVDNATALIWKTLMIAERPSANSTHLSYSRTSTKARSI